MIGRALARLFLVPIGLLLAAITGMFVIGSVGLERFTQEMHRGGDVLDAGGVLWGLFRNWGAIGRLVSAVTLVPVVLLIVVGEVARLRTAMYYVLGGGLALGVMPLLAQTTEGGASQAAATMWWQVFATGGFAAGFVYWVIAGRSA